jgi:hypothetical protein
MNAGICAVILKAYVRPFIETLNNDYDRTDDKFEAVRNAASDEGNEEILEILNWIESRNLKETFFK